MEKKYFQNVHAPVSGEPLFIYMHKIRLILSVYGRALEEFQNLFQCDKYLLSKIREQL